MGHGCELSGALVGPGGAACSGAGRATEVAVGPLCAPAGAVAVGWGVRRGSDHREREKGEVLGLRSAV